MEQLFLIGATGYVALSIYNHRLTRTYAESNTNRFLISVVLWGFFPYLVLIIVKGFAKQNSYLFEYFKDHNEHIFPTEAVTALFISLFIGYLSSAHCSQKIKRRFLNFLKINAVDPQTTGLVEFDWLRFTKSGQALIITLKNKKVYIGYMMFADYHDNMEHDIRAIRVLPLKSGHRDSDGEVVYDTFYFLPEKINEKTAETEFNSLDSEAKEKYDYSLESYLEELTEQEYTKTVNQIKPLVIFQREIISYTIYSKELDEKFHGSAEES